MFDLSKLFTIPFEDPRISFGEHLAFSREHLRRVKAQNESGDHAGQFAAIVAATQPLFDAFSLTMTDRDSTGVEREAETLAKNQALKTFQTAVSRREGLIRSAFDRTAPQYQEFFPQGLTEYAQATLENAEVLVDRMAAKTLKYVLQLGQPIVDEFAALRTAFKAALTTQQEQTGDVANAIRQRQAARVALSRQLMLNALDLAKLFLGQPERCADFFDLSIIKEPVRAKKEEPPPAPPAPPAA